MEQSPNIPADTAAAPQPEGTWKAPGVPQDAPQAGRAGAGMSEVQRAEYRALYRALERAAAAGVVLTRNEWALMSPLEQDLWIEAKESLQVAEMVALTNCLRSALLGDNTVAEQLAWPFLTEAEQDAILLRRAQAAAQANPQTPMGG